MTTTDLVILSSSPPKGLIICDSDEERNITPPRPQAILPQSSSPELPSLSAILSRRTDIPAALKSGSKAAQPPQGVDLGFLSAANLVKEQGPGLGKGSPRVEDRAPSVHDDEQLAEPKSAGKLKKVTKRTNTTRVKPKDDLAAKKPRNRKGKGTADVLAEEDGPQSGAYGSNQVRSDPVVGGELANNENPIVGPEPKSVKPRARKAKTVASVVTGKDGSTLVPTKAKKQTRKKATEAGAKRDRNVTGTVSTHFTHTKPGKEPVCAAPRDISPLCNKPLDLETAIARRRSWTPVSPSKDAAPTSPTSVTLERVDASTATQAARTSASVCDSTFTNLMNSFNYAHEAPDAVSAKPARNESGEALTKRRKIEVLGLPENQARTIAKPKMTNFDQLIDHAMTPAVPENSESPAKKDKAARKKPRTITDLATSAYRPDVPKAADSTKSANISKFFAPQKPVSEKPQPEDETEPPKPKRKRAPRQKSPVKKDGVTKPGKAAAKTKNIVKLVSEKLLSPETAKRRMDAQDILFGTSSQLAREDSPTFVRALQQAMQESDAAALGRCGELESLHLRPRPLGSGFSLVGKRRGLWAAAARDEEDTVTDGGVDLPPSPAALPTADVDTAAPISSEEDPLQQDDPPQMESIEIRSSSPPTGLAKEVLRPFDQLLPRTSNDDSHDNTRQVPAFCPPRGDEFDDLPSAQPVEPSSDFMDIDDIEDSELPAHNVFPAMSGPLSPKASSLSPFRRQALQALPMSGNIPVLSKTPLGLSEMRFKSTLATTKVATEPPISATNSSAPRPTRPVGRPRKASPSPSPSATFLSAPPPKRPVGRPRKSSTEPPNAATSPSAPPPTRPIGRPRKVSPRPNTTNPPSAPPSKRPVGRPRKLPADPSLPLAPHQPNPLKRPLSQPPPLLPTTPWTNIDEISDSHSETPTTPSPPRRPNPAPTSPLPLAPSPSFPILPAAVLNATMANAGGSVALELLSDLRNGVFCRISAAIKGASPTTDPSRPGWWERILLYDPVVVEDLTGWLNGAGVRILVGGKAGRAKAGPKKKKKGKGKGGNKGGGRVDGAEEGVEVEVEVEAEVDAVEQERQTELHELPAWIVQKWCEEHSVCCVYRESLRNGKRSRW